VLVNKVSEIRLAQHTKCGHEHVLMLVGMLLDIDRLWRNLRSVASIHSVTNKFLN
jgi:hypothetical protein